MRSIVVPLFVGAVSIAAPALAQIRAGGEFQVNVYTTGSQNHPSVAIDAAGRLVVSWSNSAPGGGVFTRRFDAAGAPVTGDVTVVSAGGLFSESHVASSYAGDFVVSWVTSVVGPLGTSLVMGRSFSAEGAPGATFSTSSPKGFGPRSARTPDGGFVVVWFGTADVVPPNSEIFGQRFDAAGARLGGEFKVNTYTTSGQGQPSVAVDAQGDFMVAWHSYDQEGRDFGIYAQRFNAGGARLGGEFRVNGATAADQSYPRLAVAAEEGFVVVWQSDGQDGDGFGVFGRRFAADGTPLGAEFQVNTYTTADQSRPEVAADAAGNFVVSWASMGQDGAGSGIFAQRFSSLAERRGAEFQVNTYTSFAQYLAAVALDPYGNMTVAWT